jgi:A/G-specific adenine glycosylase
LPPSRAGETAVSVSARTVSVYRRALRAWYRRNARDLPWRRNPTPYRVWISEIMLQQTRVETVIPYYERFLERFPDVQRLARAREEDVLAAWSGLGYYRRARMLHAAARRLVSQFDGCFPSSREEILSLPGIGTYTAGAIRSIAFGLRAPLLDGNVIRVLSRCFGVRGDVSRGETRRRLHELAERIVNAAGPGEVNQAEMELGALVCTPASPHCGDCPVGELCAARREGSIESLPELPARRSSVAVRCTALLVWRDGDGRLLLRRRLPDELLPDLWDLPGAFTARAGDDGHGADVARALLPFPVELRNVLGTLRHAVTYRRIVLEIVTAVAPAKKAGSRVRGTDGAELRWCTPREAQAMALSAPARRVLSRWGSPPRRSA